MFYIEGTSDHIRILDFKIADLVIVADLDPARDGCGNSKCVSVFVLFVKQRRFCIEIQSDRFHQVIDGSLHFRGLLKELHLFIEKFTYVFYCLSIICVLIHTSSPILF